MKIFKNLFHDFLTVTAIIEKYLRNGLRDRASCHECSPHSTQFARPQSGSDCVASVGLADERLGLIIDVNVGSKTSDMVFL